MISVIIPLHNKRSMIARTINSILNQTLKDLEIIVVNDGSTDDSLSVVPTLSSVIPAKAGIQMKIISGLGHFGANWARNYGAHLAQGEYLFFCDADIILKSYALEYLKNALDKNLKASYAYCSFQLGWKKMLSRPFNAEQLKKINYISTMSLIRRKDFSGFDEKIEKFQDWDLWLTMLERGKAGVLVPEVLFYAEPARRGKSKWLPKIFYKLPWLQEVKKYNAAREIIIKKHKL
ncbi:MAG: glycosyltransferase family A protein [bacterium]